MARRPQSFFSPSDAQGPSPNEDDAPQQYYPGAYWHLQHQLVPPSRQHHSPLISSTPTPLSQPADTPTSAVDVYGHDQGYYSATPGTFPVGPTHPQINLPHVVIDPTLEDSAPFQNSSLAGGPQSGVSDLDPIYRFYNHHSSDPWNPERALGTLGDEQSPVNSDASRAYFRNFGPDLENFRGRSAPASEVESHDTAPADSGYGPSTKSVRSEGTVVTTTDFSGLSRRFQVMMPPGTGPWGTTRASSALDGRSDSDTPGMRGDNPSGYPCERCGQVLKCPSDLKKHTFKHDKPFVCEIPGCNWKRGFTTLNDLVRHKKSRHKINSTTKNYRCSAASCRSKTKIWPRLDNFKQHVKRMHPEENLDDLITKSEYFGDLDPSASAKLETEGLDDTLAGIDDKSKNLEPRQESQKAAENPPRPSIGSGWDRDTLDLQPTLSFGTDQVADRPWPARGRSQNHPGYSAGLVPPGAILPSTETVGSISSPGQDTLAAAAAGGRAFSRKISPDAPSRIASGNNNDASKGSRGRLANTEAEAQGSRDGNSTSSARSTLALDLSRGDLEDILERILSEAAGSSVAQDSSSRTAPRGGSQETKLDISAVASLTPDKRDIWWSAATLLKHLGEMHLAKKESVKQAGSRSQGRSSGPRIKNKKCPRCREKFATNSELRKHLNRHERPYGCTYPNCHKLFGSKSDWKRHEHSQHFQLEMWRCRIPAAHQRDSAGSPNAGSSSDSDSGNPLFPRVNPVSVCGDVFWRREDFITHLSAHHSITSPEERRREVGATRIGRNGQSRFWCGFCCTLCDLQQRRQHAWDERFDHIDAHFRRERRRITEWWCLEARKTKAEVHRETNKKTFDDIDSVGRDSSDVEPATSVVDDSRPERPGRQSTGRPPVAATTASPSTGGTNSSATRSPHVHDDGYAAEHDDTRPRRPRRLRDASTDPDTRSTPSQHTSPSTPPAKRLKRAHREAFALSPSTTTPSSSTAAIDAAEGAHTLLAPHPPAPPADVLPLLGPYLPAPNVATGEHHIAGGVGEGVGAHAAATAAQAMTHWYCCECAHGPMRAEMYDKCLQCERPACQACMWECGGAEEGDDDDDDGGGGGGAGEAEEGARAGWT